MSANPVVDILNDLIKTCNDGKKGFAAAADDVTRADLRHAMLTGMSRCATSAAELEQLVRGLYGEPPLGGTAAGALHRGWTEVKATLSGNTDLALIEECERGEDAAKKSYRKALDDNLLSPEVREVVERQYQGVVQNHDHIRAIRESLREAAHA